jgi:hypothetical protein
MLLRERRSYWLFGIFFGALLGGVYAFASHMINVIYLPGIPLLPPSGTFSTYLLEYIFLGALLGFISALPEARLAGVALGGFATATGSVFFTLLNQWGTPNFGSTLITMLYTYLPLVVLMMPLAFVIRVCVDAQEPDPDNPHLWARRFIVPGLVVLVVVLVGSFSLYSSNTRAAVKHMDNLLRVGMRASSMEDLPAPLRDVQGFSENAQGEYGLRYSDNIEQFFGPRPAGAELSQFLVIARYQNGFALACIFSENRVVPTCANHR